MIISLVRHRLSLPTPAGKGIMFWQRGSGKARKGSASPHPAPLLPARRCFPRRRRPAFAPTTSGACTTERTGPIGWLRRLRNDRGTKEMTDPVYSTYTCHLFGADRGRTDLLGVLGLAKPGRVAL